MVEARVPERFRRAVLLHLFKNLDPGPDPSVPLILGIHGPSGEGKTFQCRKLLSELDVRVQFISGGELESPEAGAPAELIRRAYSQARAWRATGGEQLNPALLLLNDIDTAVGDWGEQVQYTVNRQVVLGELMHLADFPDADNGRRAPRVPVILTGNDFTKLYGPLIRLGRMTLFNWSPTPTEKLEMVRGLYPELTDAECARLVSTFGEQSVAFFAQLRAGLGDESLWSYIKQVGVTTAFDDLAQGRVARVHTQAELDRLIALGHDLAAARTGLRDHLTGRDEDDRDQDLRADQDTPANGIHQVADRDHAPTRDNALRAVAPVGDDGH